MSTLKEKIAELDTSKFAEEFKKAQEKLREKFPTPDSFMKLMKKMKDMTPEDREKFKESVGKNFKEFTKNLTRDKPAGGATFYQYALFIGMVLLVIVVIGFFGRKLYRSIKEKEQKKERKPKKSLKTQSPPGSPITKKAK